MDTCHYLIRIDDNDQENLIIALKDHLEGKYISGTEHLDFVETKAKSGEMGIGEVMSALSLVIKAANNPLTELAKALRDFVQSYRTEIKIDRGGSTITISSSRPQKIEELVKILLNQP